MDLRTHTLRAAALAVALAAAGAAIAQPAALPGPPLPTVISRPDWTELPDGASLTRVYPQRASRMGIEGHVRLECTVTAEGGLEACGVIAETPADQGFGDAALKLSTLFRMRAMTIDGVAVGGAKVIIPLHFIVPPRRHLLGKWF